MIKLPFCASMVRATLGSLAIMMSAYVVTSGQDLPTAKSLASEMGLAWNIGNSLEVPKDPLLWGNPLPTQTLIDSVKAAGFKTIRIPCAWYSHADTNTNVIDAAWMTQVKTVVDYCIKDSLFVILNIHWDSGWLESHIDEASKNGVNKRQGAFWRQIATTFRNYDRHLLFASANEPAMQDAYGTAFGPDRMAVLMSYHQTFIDTVRATGGNNTSRTLIVQGPRTDIALTDSVMTTMPTDKIADRLMAEVHFYPFQFCLMETDADWGKVFYYWGKNNHSTTDTDRNSTWCEEAFVDSMCNILKKRFTDKNVPVIIGEFGAVKRLSLTGDSLKRHIQSRRSFYEYVVSASKRFGFIPVPWDAGNQGNLTMTIFDRKTGAIYDLGLLNAIRYGYGLSKLPGDTSLVQVATVDKSMKALYSAKDSAWGQMNLGVVKANITNYDSIIVRAYLNGETNYDSAGTQKFGWLSLSVVTMSNGWKWKEGSFGALTMNNWKNYSIPISTDTTNKAALVPADPTKIDFFALQAYSHGYHGTIYVDWIVFKSKAGVYDTVYSFNLTSAEKTSGNVESATLIETSTVPSDVEWKTATKKPNYTAVIKRYASTRPDGLHISSSNGQIAISGTIYNAGVASLRILNLQGKTIGSHLVSTKKGLNSFKVPASYHGTMIVQFEQGDQKFSERVIIN